MRLRVKRMWSNGTYKDEVVEMEPNACEACDKIAESPDIAELSQIRFRHVLCGEHFREAKMGDLPALKKKIRERDAHAQKVVDEFLAEERRAAGEEEMRRIIREQAEAEEAQRFADERARIAESGRFFDG